MRYNKILISHRERWVFVDSVGKTKVLIGSSGPISKLEVISKPKVKLEFTQILLFLQREYKHQWIWFSSLRKKKCKTEYEAKLWIFLKLMKIKSTTNL